MHQYNCINHMRMLMAYEASLTLRATAAAFSILRSRAARPSTSSAAKTVSSFSRYLLPLIPGLLYWRSTLSYNGTEAGACDYLRPCIFQQYHVQPNNMKNKYSKRCVTFARWGLYLVSQRVSEDPCHDSTLLAVRAYDMVFLVRKSSIKRLFRLRSTEHVLRSPCCCCSDLGYF